MSSLVDYGSSDESGNESVNDEDIKPVLESELPILNEIEENGNSRTANEDEKYSKLGLFSSLPPPRIIKPGFILNTDDILIVSSRTHLQKKQPVKITIPSLSEVNGILSNACF
jgi:hypothetical protein